MGVDRGARARPRLPGQRIADPLRGERELAVAETALARTDAAARGYKLFTPDEARAVNPALRGAFDAALYCERDAAVEPRTAQLALREALSRSPAYTFLPGREVRDVVGEHAVRDDHGDVHTGDVVVLCTGAWLGGLVRELAGPELPVRRVRLQMMQTDPSASRSRPPSPTPTASGTTPPTAAPPSTSSTRSSRRPRPPPSTGCSCSWCSARTAA